MPDFTARPIKILIVEDSSVAREFLKRLFQAEPGLEVIGCAIDGQEAIAMASDLQPDVITMDIHMEGLDGFETTQRIMAIKPVPIVIVSAKYDPADVRQAFRALEAGAVGMTEKPPGFQSPGHEESVARLVELVKTMAAVELSPRRPLPPAPPAAGAPGQRALKSSRPPATLVAIGASTCGPPVLATLLGRLNQPFPAPILVVQQIAPGFMPGLADWLRSQVKLPIRIATHRERALPGTVYLAPDGCQLRIGSGGVMQCTGEDPVHGQRPAIGCLFESAARLYGRSGVGVLLTGVGEDGAAELKLMRERGATTFAQDGESAAVSALPRAAARLGAASHILPPEAIAASLNGLVGASPS